MYLDTMYMYAGAYLVMLLLTIRVLCIQLIYRLSHYIVDLPLVLLLLLYILFHLCVLVYYKKLCL